MEPASLPVGKDASSVCGAGGRGHIKKILLLSKSRALPRFFQTAVTSWALASGEASAPREMKKSTWACLALHFAFRASPHISWQALSCIAAKGAQKGETMSRSSDFSASRVCHTSHDSFSPSGHVSHAPIPITLKGPHALMPRAWLTVLAVINVLPPLEPAVVLLRLKFSPFATPIYFNLFLMFCKCSYSGWKFMFNIFIFLSKIGHFFRSELFSKIFFASC